MKKGDTIVTVRGNAGTIGYNVSKGRWCVYFPNKENGGLAEVDESAINLSLTKEELESLSKKYYKRHKEGYEFVNFHIGQGEIEDAFKTGVVSGIEIGYRLADEVMNKVRNNDYATK